MKFVAIPVGQGDSFYMERAGKSILIDGGRSRKKFTSLFMHATGERHVNYVVCTHNDADHVLGILGFLEDPTYSCDELWLPGSWLTILPDVLRPFTEVLQELLNDLQTRDIKDTFACADHRPSNYQSIAALGDIVHESTVPHERDHQNSTDIVEDGWPTSCRNLLRNVSQWEIADGFKGWTDNTAGAKPSVSAISDAINLEPKKRALISSFIHAADRIKRIAAVAYQRRVKVRWFEFSLTLPCGGEAILKPLNSREALAVKSRSGSLAAWLALTAANKESLVFWSPSANEQPGVLFTSDSDLAGLQIPPNLAGAIVTAPHHGSEANARVYGAVITATSNAPIVWLRSDGQYLSRPCRTYVGLRPPRYCTVCRLGTGAWTVKKGLAFNVLGGAWISTQGSRRCSCV